MKRALPALAAAATIAAAAAGCGSSGPSASAIAANIGAESCNGTSYEIVNRLDHSRARIFDCQLNGKTICVTEENGIDQDVTQEAKLLFANALNGQAPDCATS